MFENTKIAFASKTTKELKSAHFLFNTIKNPVLVKIGEKLLSFALKTHLPISWIVKPTIFKHFCGGENINECNNVINKLWEYKIGTILDYSAEGNNNEENFHKVMLQILDVIERSKDDVKIPFAVFKTTGLARLELLEKINSKQELTEKEKEEYDRIKLRIDTLCNRAYKYKLPIFIDAEESWIQDPIDAITTEMMLKYNKEKAIVYNTLQMYRHDRISFLNELISKAKENNFYIGLKLVRGAYMEKERERAIEMGYPSPIHVDKVSTDKDYDKAIKICVDNNDLISVCVGTHNEESALYFTQLINERNLDKQSSKFYFAQLLGMSDHISYNLSNQGYNVTKYVPFGPVKSVLPYLIRRAQENTSIANQTTRELNLINKELLRRKVK
ncbi:MAG: proline dehydrogenase family protein [Bacteroidota bacterium]